MLGNITKHRIEVKYKCNISKDNSLKDSVWVAHGKNKCNETFCLGYGKSLSELDENIKMSVEVDDL